MQRIDSHFVITTPEALWQFRHAILGGKSAVTWNSLPATLEDCETGVQEDHYAQACLIMAVYFNERGSENVHALAHVPCPSKVTIERSCQLRDAAWDAALTMLKTAPRLPYC